MQFVGGGGTTRKLLNKSANKKGYTRFESALKEMMNLALKSQRKETRELCMT